jgi:RNA polymerase sigma-70 factor (ECF subfamily)
METVLSDTEAIARAQNGDASAYGVLVKNHESAAFRAALLILRDASSAEDVAQEAFVRAYRELGRFRAGESFRPWLLRIVTNLALNEKRSATRRIALFDRAGRQWSPAFEPALDEQVAANDEAATLWRAIDRLDERDRLVLYLRYFLELDEKEMAQAIGKPAGTVKSRLFRASRRLRELIQRDYPELRTPND